MGMKGPVFVAETDEDGAVTCVWVQDGKRRSARVVRRKYLADRDLDSGQFHGASRRSILNWIDARPDTADRPQV